MIHQIWLGGRPIPEQFMVWSETWGDPNPGWVRRLWTDRDVEEGSIELSLPDLYRSFDNPGFRSDLLRYDILLSQGGVYVDMDVECLRPLDECLLEAASFNPHASLIAGYERPAGNMEFIANAVLAATPGSTVISDFIRSIPGRLDNVRSAKVYHDLFDTVMSSSGPTAWTQHCRLASGVTVVPYDWFHPIEDSGRAYCRHHFSGSWIGRCPPAPPALML